MRERERERERDLHITDICSFIGQENAEKKCKQFISGDTDP